MSKIIEQIKRITSGFEVPIGFKKPLYEAMLPSILLIKDVSNQVDIKNITGINVETDAAMIDIAGLDPTAIIRFAGSRSNVPVGIQWGKENSAAASSLITKDIDFVIFDLDSKIGSLDREGLGRILRINRLLTPGMIKAINDLNMSVDCVMLDNDKGEIDVEVLLRCHLFTDIVNKPLIINIAHPLTISELDELSNANVRALILSSDISSERIKQLRNDIASLPKINKKKTAKRPLIPRITTVTMPEEVEVEDEAGAGLL